MECQCRYLRNHVLNQVPWQCRNHPVWFFHSSGIYSGFSNRDAECVVHGDNATPMPFEQTNPVLDFPRNSSLWLLWSSCIYPLLHSAPCIYSSVVLYLEMSPCKPRCSYVLVFVKVWPLVLCSLNPSISCLWSSLALSRSSFLLVYDARCILVRMSHSQ